MVSPASALCFVQGAPLRLQGRSRSVEVLGRSRRQPRAMRFSSTKFNRYMTPIQNNSHLEIQPLTVSDYHVLVDAGCLDNRRVELLHGQLVAMAPQSYEHVNATWILNDIFSAKLRNRAIVRPSMPITFINSNSEPEPDIVIASGVPSDYFLRHPAADDILLLVEVAKSTLHKDSNEKLRLYASQNVQEYWIVDVKRRSVRVLRYPKGNSYSHDNTFCAGDIAPAALPDAIIQVKDLFPSKETKGYPNR